jgi:hypothetical protein
MTRPGTRKAPAARRRGPCGQPADRLWRPDGRLSRVRRRAPCRSPSSLSCRANRRRASSQRSPKSQTPLGRPTAAFSVDRPDPRNRPARVIFKQAGGNSCSASIQFTPLIGIACSFGGTTSRPENHRCAYPPHCSAAPFSHLVSALLRRLLENADLKRRPLR